MRIAYVALHFQHIYRKGGVGRKMHTQCRLWREAGHTVQLFLHSPDLPPDAADSVFRFGARSTLPLVGGVLLEISRSRALHRLIRAVAAYQPDLVYLRYGLYTLPLRQLFRVAPVVVETNTNDVEEYRHRGWFIDRLNRFGRGIIFRQAAGFIAASREIAALPAFTRFHKPSRTISNGFDLERTALLPAPANQPPRVAFAGTSVAPWYGLDQLLAFAGENPDIAFDLVGYQPEQFPPEQRHTNVCFHGWMEAARVRGILAAADVVCGSLALYRNRMQEGSSLKIREALGYGIPVILAYTDSDLSGQGLDFVLELPNREDNLLDNSARVRDFIMAMRGRRAQRSAVAPLIGMQAKEAQRLAFFQEILDRAAGRSVPGGRDERA